MKPKDVIKLIKDEDIEVVDYRFTDFPGQWQHFSVPAKAVSEDDFNDGLGFDGSSIRGWQAINESDMLVIPDPTTAFVDPFFEHKTLVLTCHIEDPITRERYSRDPRSIAQKAMAYLNSSGIGDVAYFGPEAEFFIFDDVRFAQTANTGFYQIDSFEGEWNTGSEELPNLGHKPRHKEGYFPVPPIDSGQDLRQEMVRLLEACDIEIECQHHEVATAGQAEIDVRFAPLVEMADKMMRYKYIVKNTAHKSGKTVTFMPKPVFEDNGSGMHTHISIWKGGENLFAGDGYAGLSETAMHAIGGILEHAPSLLAFTNPTTNSYKRLVPGYEAPVNLAYSSRNRSAAVRLPMYSASPKSKRIEFRCPDPTANPYLAFSALLMAALDGIENETDPGAALDKNIYALTPAERAGVPSTPPTLAAALDALEANHDYLMKGDVFTKDVIETQLEYKRENEVDALALRPHPYEFFLYYDC